MRDDERHRLRVVPPKSLAFGRSRYSFDFFSRRNVKFRGRRFGMRFGKKEKPPKIAQRNTSRDRENNRNNKHRSPAAEGRCLHKGSKSHTSPSDPPCTCVIITRPRKSISNERGTVSTDRRALPRSLLIRHVPSKETSTRICRSFVCQEDFAPFQTRLRTRYDYTRRSGRVGCQIFGPHTPATGGRAPAKSAVGARGSQR